MRFELSKLEIKMIDVSCKLFESDDKGYDVHAAAKWMVNGSYTTFYDAIYRILIESDDFEIELTEPVVLSTGTSYKFVEVIVPDYDEFGNSER